MYVLCVAYVLKDTQDMYFSRCRLNGRTRKKVCAQSDSPFSPHSQDSQTSSNAVSPGGLGSGKSGQLIPLSAKDVRPNRAAYCRRLKPHHT